MPTSAPELIQARDRLGEGLRGIFRDGAATVSLIEEAPFPTVLLQLKSEMAAFAVSNGRSEECYEESYRWFKELYAERHNEWDKLNLSFVLCLPRRRPEVDALRAALETDAYFCRKFVVFLEGAIADELSRLPFIPLGRGTTSFQRPASAQTVLRERGVPARLAEAIVAQH